MITENVDIEVIHIHLNELKAKFDNVMRNGGTFAEVKKIYMEIKELECHSKVLEWEADNRKKELQ